jgi:hypothetical protein
MNSMYSPPTKEQESTVMSSLKSCQILFKYISSIHMPEGHPNIRTQGLICRVDGLCRRTQTSAAHTAQAQKPPFTNQASQYTMEQATGLKRS